MKKLSLIWLLAYLFVLCACTKLTAISASEQEQILSAEAAAAQRIAAESDAQASAVSTEDELPESYEVTEAVPTLSELKGSTMLTAGLSLLKSQQYGPITVSYYAAASEFDVWDAKQALFGAAETEAPAQMDWPDDLGFEPFRTYSNPSATSLLICKYEPASEAEPPVYYQYDGTELSACSALNDCSFGPVNPAHVRWRGEHELVYDAESPETHRMTTCLYNVQTKTEQVLLADYDPFPFHAGDTVDERFLLIHDTYVLRVERGGTVFLRTLPDGTEKMVPGIQTPDTAYFHMTALDQTTTVYFSVGEDGHYTTLAFIDCGSGDCAKLERTVPSGIQELYPLLLSEDTIAIPANARMAEEEESGHIFLLVYTFSKHGLSLLFDSVSAG